MAYSYLDSSVLDTKEALPFPATGGLDLTSDKLSVFPGSLQDCLNYEVGIDQGYTLSKGLLEYSMADFHVPDFVYIGTAELLGASSTYPANYDAFIVGAELDVSVEDKASATVVGTAKLKILHKGPRTGANFTVYFRLISGMAINSDLEYVFTLNQGVTINVPATGPFFTAYPDIALWTTVHTNTSRSLAPSSMAQEVPGKGAIISIMEIEDDIYVARQKRDEVLVTFTINATKTLETPIPYVMHLGGSNYTICYLEGFLSATSMVVRIKLPPNVANRIILPTGSVSILTPEDAVTILEDEYIGQSKTINFIPAVIDDRGNVDATGPAETFSPITAENLNIQQHGAVIWKEADTNNRKTYLHWDEVDMGKEIQFVDGTTEPVTGLSRLFVDDEDDEERDIDSLIPNAHSGGTGWTNTANSYDDNPASFAAALGALMPGSSDTWQIRSGNPDFTFNNIQLPANAVVKSIRVDLSCRKSNAAGAYNVRPAVRLKNGTTVGAWRPSGVSLDNTISFQARAIDFGSGYTSLTVNKSLLESSDFKIEVGVQGQNTGSAWVTPSMDVASIELTITYVDGTESVYFYDTTDTVDVAEADIVHSFKETGDWDTEDAEGVLTLYNLTDVDAVSDGLQIRTGPSGTGELIAVVKGTPSSVYLPTYQQLTSNKSIVDTIKANFYSDVRGEAIYGATGAGPAFMFNGTFFIQIRTGVPTEREKPRHVYNHANHLVLAYSSGQILVSVTGIPTDFTGVRGASEWGFGDSIVGFIPLSGSALGVLCRRSVQALVGTSPLSFNTQMISNVSGAIEYTAAGVASPMFCNENGVTNVEATAAYGDFNVGKLSRYVYSLLQPRLQEDCACGTLGVKMALPVRAKNQYKLFFLDGLVVTFSMAETAEGIVPMPTIQRYDSNTTQRRFVPTCGLSTVLSTGKEAVLIGTEEGRVYVIDGCMGVQIGQGNKIKMPAHITFNPFNAGVSHLNLKYNEVLVHGSVVLPTELSLSAGVNYFRPEVDSQEDSIIFGERDTLVTPSNKRVPAKSAGRLPSITDGFSLKIGSESFDTPQHVIQAITYRPKVASDKTASPRSRMNG